MAVTPRTQTRLNHETSSGNEHLPVRLRRIVGSDPVIHLVYPCFFETISQLELILKHIFINNFLYSIWNNKLIFMAIIFSI